MKIRIWIGCILIVIFVGTMVLLNLNHIVNSTTEIIGLIVGVLIIAGIFGIRLPKN
jgi:hypothetical protein